MCRWFSIFLLPYVVYIISAHEQEERNSLPRAVHLRRHKRAEQVRTPDTSSRTSFMFWKNDPQCMKKMKADRDMMSCPKRNPDDPYEKLICIEPQDLCDDRQDCPGGEDEEPHFCMFKKLEDAEMRRIKAEIYLLVHNSRKQQPEYKDVVVNNDVTSDTSGGIKQPTRPGVFKISGLGPLGKSKMFQNEQNEEDPNKSVEEDEDDEENEDEEDEEEEEEEEEERRKEEEKKKNAARKHDRRRRTYRHLLQLEAANL